MAVQLNTDAARNLKSMYGDPVSASASIVTLVGTAITLIQQIQNARDNMRRIPKILRNVSKQLEALVQSLNLVKEKERLRTPSVKQQVSVIIEISQELNDVFERIRAGRTKHVVWRFFHALTSAEKDDKQVGEILDRLDRARDELVLRISVTLVGLVGNLKNGFDVAYDVLIETNKKVTKILGKDLVLADRLKGRSRHEPGGTVALDIDDIKSLGLADPDVIAAQIPVSQQCIDERTGNINVGGSVDEDANTGILTKRDVANEALPQVPSATIAGETGHINIGTDAKRNLNTGIATYN